MIGFGVTVMITIVVTVVSAVITLAFVIFARIGVTVSVIIA